MTACQFPVEFLKNVQYAVGPPSVLQTEPPVSAITVQGSDRGPKVIGVTVASVGVTVVPDGRSCDFKFEVFGAAVADCCETSATISTTGSPEATEVPPLPDAPVVPCGYMSTYASCGELPLAARTYVE